MEGESLIRDGCLGMFFYALKLAADNNIEGAKEVLHDIEAKYRMSYISMEYAIQEILGKHSTISKSCTEQVII